MTPPKPNMPCGIYGCPDARYARGYCDMHYRRLLKHGDVQAHKPKQHQRHGLSLDDLTDKGGGPNACWPWLGNMLPAGYGVKGQGKNNAYAHRLVYEKTYGPVPPGMYVCHLCDNPSCVNPAHFFLGTPTDNAQDMVRKGRHHLAARTHCKRGHPFNEANTYRPPSEPHTRQCKACRKKRNNNA